MPSADTKTQAAITTGSSSHPLRSGLHTMSLVVIGVLVLAASAQIQVPFWPVKLSLQSFAVLALAATYGARLGVATVAAYIALGIAGFPVFQGTGGVGTLGGPTSGYLAGFVIATLIVGRLSDGGFLRRTGAAIAAFVIGDLAIMIAGTAWLATLIGVERAFHAGFLIFLPAEALKILLAVAITRLTHRHA